MEYIRLCNGVADKGTLVEKQPFFDKPYDFINNVESDWYISMFDYNDIHYKQFQKTGSVAGIDEVTTDRVIFDFDSDDLDKSLDDTLTCLARLYDKDISPEEMNIYFSGNKGFHVELYTKDKFTPEEMKNLAVNLVGDLPTLDKQIYNASRIIRLPSKHQKSGLFKVPLSQVELLDGVDTVKHAATIFKPVKFKFQTKLPDNLIELSKIIPKPEKSDVNATLDIDFHNKPKGWIDAKFALLNGLIPNGIGHQAFLCLAATLRSMGYNQTLTYSMLEAANDLRVKRGFRKHEVKDIEHCVNEVYADWWKGGTYSVKEPGWLRDYAIQYGFLKDELNDIVTTQEVFDIFKSYATTFKDNIIPTGLASLDRQAKFLVGTSNAILGSPSSGKTTTILNMLNHASHKKLQSIFFSYDMFHSLVFTRMIQKHFSLQQEEIFHLAETNPVKLEQFKEKLIEEYAKVRFCFKSGQTPADIERTILDVQQNTGEKVKFVAIDYNELIVANVSEPTAASAQVAQELRRIANDHAVCLVTLLQPSKIYSNPAEETLNYSAAKGSSAIAQSVTLMLGINRPGWSPQRPEQDKFMSINCIKNRMGKLFHLDFHFNGLNGELRELNDYEAEELEEIREARKKAKSEGDGGGSPW